MKCGWRQRYVGHPGEFWDIGNAEVYQSGGEWFADVHVWEDGMGRWQAHGPFASHHDAIAHAEAVLAARQQQGEDAT